MPTISVRYNDGEACPLTTERHQKKLRGSKEYDREIFPFGDVEITYKDKDGIPELTIRGPVRISNLSYNSTGSGKEVFFNGINLIGFIKRMEKINVQGGLAKITSNAKQAYSSIILKLRTQYNLFHNFIK